MSIQVLSSVLTQRGIKHIVVSSNEIGTPEVIAAFRKDLEALLDRFVGMANKPTVLKKILQDKLVISKKYSPSALEVAKTSSGNLIVKFRYRTEKGIEASKYYLLLVEKNKITGVQA